MSNTIQINRAPVLTLWAAVVAERLGYDRATALTLGKAVAGLNAQSKGRRLRIYEAPAHKKPAKKAAKPSDATAKTVSLLGREVPVVRAGEGLRASTKERAENPAAVERYLTQKFGDALGDARAAMEALASSYAPADLADAAFGLYEEFRPAIPDGKRGWGAKGVLDLDRVRDLASARRR